VQITWFQHGKRNANVLTGIATVATVQYPML